MVNIDPRCTYVLITGANAGLGSAICSRLIDEFLATKPSTSTLNLIITTRSTKKSQDTLVSLRKHLKHNANNTPSSPRITFRSLQVDLLDLNSVLALSRNLLTTLPRLDILYLNAGISGVRAINWPPALWEATVDTLKATTYPSYLLHHVGLLAKPQLPANTSPPEPPLGEVFTANVFGHYMLTHALMPLLTSTPRSHPARIIWIGSIEATAAAFNASDIQGIQSPYAYHSSKRLTEVLALNASLPPSQNAVSSFLSTPTGDPIPQSLRPKTYVCHPGVCDTKILPLMIVVLYLKLLAFYFARWLGSPWHTITTYQGATAPVWLGLTPQDTLDALEEKDGKAKWGSATDAWGREKVLRTEVEGWGFGGTVGDESRFGGRAVRRVGAPDLTDEARRKFETLGGKVWDEMERLRVEWEGRLRRAE